MIEPSFIEEPRDMWSFRRAVVALIALAGLLVAADRVAAWFAGDEVANRAEDELASHDVVAAGTGVEADVAGFPFLTQVASGEYQEVKLQLVVGYDSIAEQSGVEWLEFLSNDYQVWMLLPLVFPNGTETEQMIYPEIRAAGNEISFWVDEVPGNGVMTREQRIRTAEQLSFDYEMPELPYRYTVESVRPGLSGIEVTLRAVDVPH